MEDVFPFLLGDFQVNHLKFRGSNVETVWQGSARLKLTWPLKTGLPKKKYIFQPLIFRGNINVSFREVAVCFLNKTAFQVVLLDIFLWGGRVERGWTLQWMVVVQKSMKPLPSIGCKSQRCVKHSTLPEN